MSYEKKIMPQILCKDNPPISSIFLLESFQGLINNVFNTGMMNPPQGKHDSSAVKMVAVTAITTTATTRMIAIMIPFSVS